MQIIAFTNDANKVSVLSPSPNSGLTLEQIAQKDIPQNSPYIILDESELPDRADRDRWMIQGNSVIIDNSISLPVSPPNWDVLYGQFLAGDLKPIFDDVCEEAENSTAIALRYFNLVESFKIRTEQALKDCLDKLIQAGYVVSEDHKSLWNNATTELNFSELVRLS